jgi:integrase
MRIKKLNGLTAAQVASAGHGWHSDGGGLFLRIDDNRRRWLFRYTFNSKKRELGMGSATAVTLAAARAEAKKHRDLLASGRDPLEERRKAKAKAEARKTFDHVARFVIERDRARWTDAHAEAWAKSLFADAERLGPLDVAAIAVADVKSVVMPIFDQGHFVAARNTLSRIASVLECAIAHGWRTSANVADWRTFKHIAPKRAKADRRHPAIAWADAPAVMAKLRAIDTAGARSVAFAILTASRISEATNAQWSEIDFDAKRWTIPEGRMKMREPHVVPLSRQALDLLDEMLKHRTGDFVFPGQVDGAAIGRMQAWRVAKDVTEGRASPHGFRSTFRDWCGDNGVARELAEAALAHTVGGVEGAYLRSTMALRRKPVMQDYADFVTGEARGRRSFRSRTGDDDPHQGGRGIYERLHQDQEDRRFLR